MIVIPSICIITTCSVGLFSNPQGQCQVCRSCCVEYRWRVSSGRRKNLDNLDLIERITRNLTPNANRPAQRKNIHSMLTSKHPYSNSKHLTFHHSFSLKTGRHHCRLYDSSFSSINVIYLYTLPFYHLFCYDYKLN